MKRAAFFVLLAVLGATVLALPASAQNTEFKAEFSEKGACPGVDLCGKGVIHGFGTVTTTLVFTSFEPGPGDCATASADRTQTLDSDGSTLLMSASGVVCGGRIEGTYTILGGTGVFAGASGSGTLWGSTTNPHVVSQDIHLRGSITL
jgi:hypothetical protein